MNMLVTDAGPVISMPGARRSSGTGGTRQSPVLASETGGCDGRTRSSSARRSTAARFSRSASTLVVNLSCSAARYPAKSPVSSESAPGSGGQLTLVVVVMGNASPVMPRWTRRILAHASSVRTAAVAEDGFPPAETFA